MCNVECGVEYALHHILHTMQYVVCRHQSMTRMYLLECICLQNITTDC